MFPNCTVWIGEKGMSGYRVGHKADRMRFRILKCFPAQKLYKARHAQKLLAFWGSQWKDWHQLIVTDRSWCIWWDLSWSVSL